MRLLIRALTKNHGKFWGDGVHLLVCYFVFGGAYGEQTLLVRANYFRTGVTVLMGLGDSLILGGTGQQLP